MDDLRAIFIPQAARARGLARTAEQVETDWRLWRLLFRAGYKLGSIEREYRRLIEEMRRLRGEGWQ